MPKAYPLELREVVKTMFLTGIRPETIASENALPLAIVHKWANRYKWTAIRDKAKKGIKSIGEKSLAAQAAHDLGAASVSVRNALASTLQKQAAVLAAEDPSSRDLANTRDRQGQAAIAKAIAETAEKVFGWGEETAPGMVLSIHLSSDPASKATACSVEDLKPATAELASVDSQALTLQLNDPDIVRSIDPAPAAGPVAPPSPGPDAPA